MATRNPAEQYDVDVTAMRHSRYMDYPSHVHLETLSQCNAACNFCPYPDLERKGSRMSDALIEKIVDDLTGVPRDLSFQLSPFKVNEPFLDPRLFDILALINERLPQARIALTTNSTPLTEDKLSRLSQVRNLEYLWISFNDHRPEAYEETMRLPHARTLERLNMIHRRKTVSRDLTCAVVLSRVGDGSSVDREFCRWVDATYPGFTAAIFPRGAWLGQVGVEVGAVPNVACLRWFDLSITSTGVVAHCCMDGQAQWPIGNVAQQHALEIYNAPHYRTLRERTVSRLHAEPCDRCTFL